jgi:hypothetical protein
MSKALSGQRTLAPEEIKQLRSRMAQTVDPPRKTIEYYYTPAAAAGAKRIVDKLFLEGQRIRLRREDYSLQTMRIQFYQGCKYLIDHDETNTYADKVKRTKCSIRDGEFIEFTMREAELLTNIEVDRPWRDELSEYLDNASPGQKFYKQDVSLSSDDVAWINNQLAGLVKPSGEPLFIAQVEPGMPLLLIRDEL